jgi:lactoylglutathione lyase
MKKILPVVTLSMVILFSSLTQPLSAQTMARLNHIAFYVVDLKSVLISIKTLSGLTLSPEPFHDGRHTWFSVGPKSHLHIISGAAAKTSHEKNTHLCFSVASVEAFIPSS